ncbi:antitoxin Xre-like helix-turn-helix domain-containing protein [Sphingobium herbicidovorans]|uniref:antitoxin Xre-like helix-turn-helix domain-containing protein n=1 Tax=Sphingobium herbicidovorans TaxID=76947 RepID=UPI001E3F377B|nr:antitoxin Xre-like helix-turn-helix domain-containing protein [Sphingobium herbicidovorans]
MTLDIAPFDDHLTFKQGQMEARMAETVKFGATAPLTPIDVQTFSKSADRERLSGVALKAFRAIVEHWSLSNGEAAALLGVSDSTWDRIKRGSWEQPLSQDQLTRASAAIGVYKGLHLLFADPMADQWPKLPNRGPIFQRKSPVDAMIDGGIPLMLETRRYVDAVRGGL